MAGFWEKEVDIHTVEKSKKESILVKEVTKNKADFIDIRTFFLNDEDELRPSPKGITIPKEKAKEIAEAILKHLEG